MIADFRPRSSRLPEWVNQLKQKEESFWLQPATLWDIAKVALPLVFLAFGWGVRVEINQARTEAKFDAAQTATGGLQKSVDSLRSQLDTLSANIAKQEQSNAVLRALLERK